jgi:hypothetical protein
VFSTTLNIPIPSAGTIFLAGFVGLPRPRWRFCGFAKLVFELLSFLRVPAEEVRLIDGLTNLGGNVRLRELSRPLPRPFQLIRMVTRFALVIQQRTECRETVCEIPPEITPFLVQT